MIQYQSLENHIESLGSQFRNATPVPHLIIDNFLHPEIAEKAYQLFPPLEQMDSLNDYRQKKAQDPLVSKFNPIFKDIIMDHLHQKRFTEWLSRISKIKNLKVDDKLYAAGLAQGGHGSFLNVHVDNSSHPIYPWYRRLNLLIYLNKNWTEEKGGHLELWYKGMKRSVAILPTFNRAVIFATSPTSWHGYRPVNTPEGDARKSINIYYFSEESPTGEKYYHITTFRARRNELWNKMLYPLDNLARKIARVLRPNKDSHAVLYTGQITGQINGVRLDSVLSHMKNTVKVEDAEDF